MTGSSYCPRLETSNPRNPPAILAACRYRRRSHDRHSEYATPSAMALSTCSTYSTIGLGSASTGCQTIPPASRRSGGGRLPSISWAAQHPDQHRPKHPVLLAVDRQFGEGPALRVAPELTDPLGALEVADHHVRLDPLDAKNSRHAGECEFASETDSSVLRVLLKI
jgi:hypothetical protein